MGLVFIKTEVVKCLIVQVSVRTLYQVSWWIHHFAMERAYWVILFNSDEQDLAYLKDESWQHHLKQGQDFPS